MALVTLFVFLIAGSVVKSGNVKRGVFDVNFGGAYNGFGNVIDYGPVGQQVVYPKPVLVEKLPINPPPITPAEIAGAIASAREASTAVQQAQQRVQEAKAEVLAQQRIASYKEHQAALAMQRTEAAAAVRRQEAKAAATAVVRAQQRLAQAKGEVAEQQRIAAAKEANAALAIHKSANAAAAQIQRTDAAASKFAVIKSNEESAFKHVSAAKDATLSAASAAVEASVITGGVSHGPWYGPHKYQNFQPWG